MEISIIIVNYNTKKITEECIVSLLNNPTVNNIEYEIIVVDNKSSDGSLEYLKNKKYSRTKIISNNRNSGFGQGNNLGIKNSKGEYILLLNSDTIANNLNFEKMIKIFEENNDIGILSTKILNDDNSIQSLGFKYPSVLNEIKLNQLFWNYNFVKKIRFRNYKDKGLKKVDWVSGCCMMFRKDDFENIGMFDEKIFMYAEDLDICYRMNKSGKGIYVYDKTNIYHLHGKSSEKKTLKLKNLLKIRANYYYVIKKNNICQNLLLIKISYFFNAIIVLTLKRVTKIIGR